MIQATELKLDFIKWLEGSIKEDFSITNSFLLACLDEAVELKINSTINGVPFSEYYSTTELMNLILDGWSSTARAFLQLQKSNVHITFHEVEVPAFENRQKILAQLEDLVLKCES